MLLLLLLLLMLLLLLLLLVLLLLLLLLVMLAELGLEWYLRRRCHLCKRLQHHPQRRCAVQQQHSK
jgi:hypothetical protein